MDNRAIDSLVSDREDSDSESETDDNSDCHMDKSKIELMSPDYEKRISTPIAWPYSDNQMCNKILSASASGDLITLRQSIEQTPQLVSEVKNKVYLHFDRTLYNVAYMCKQSTKTIITSIPSQTNYRLFQYMHSPPF
jgi:hypothetical protein